jgi:DNA-binding response OmpR family regulator
MLKRVLVVEDSRALLASLFAFLEPRGFMLDAARDGASGLTLALDGNYDAVVLDWMLPRLSGLEVVRQLREKGATGPVLMLTGRGALADKIAGFRAGADDYMTKPFALEELEVRLDALIARSRGRRHVLEVHDLRFDLATREVARGTSRLIMRSGGKKLLEALMRASPALVTREELEIVLWGEHPPDRDMLRSHVYELRRSVDGPFVTKLIHTLPKAGYRIAAPTGA